MSSKNARWSILVAGFMTVFVHAGAYAVDAVSFDFATGNKTQKAEFGLQWDWQRQWLQSNGTHVDGYWDLSLAQWRGTRYQSIPDATQNITDIGITPMFRFQRDSRTGLYAEGGIGAHLLSAHYDNNGRRLSTALQFGTHLGVGYAFSNKLDVGLQIEHVSNGGIKHPNDGVNFAGVRVRYRL